MGKLQKVLCFALCAVVLTGTWAMAADEPAAANDEQAKIAKESEEAAAASAKTKPTPKMIVEKVNEAAKLLEAEGIQAFAKFKGKDSKFIFAGTYIWIHDMEGVMKMHPIKYKMEGNRLIGLKDAQGKLIFAEMNKIAREQGAGWIDYMWPKPGEKAPSKKISYVKLCKVGDQELVIGCGAYDLSEEDIQKLKEEKK